MGLVTDITTLWRTGQPAIRPRAAKTVQEFGSFDLLIPWWARYNPELFVRQAYRTNPVVYQSIEYNARSIATATMYAMKSGESNKSGDDRLSYGHNLQRLLRRPSQLYVTQTRWIRQIVRQLLITGEAFVYLARDKGGRIAETQILPGAFITVLPARVGIDHYEYRPEGQAEPIQIAPENMVFLRMDDPLEPLRGCSPLAVAWREVQTDNSTQDFRKAFFDNSAIPGGVLTTNLPASPEQLRDWSDMFAERFSGAKNAGKTPALAGGLTYQKAGAMPGEVDFGNVTALSETRICMAFGMHPILIAAKAGLERSTYSNFKEAKAAYWEDTAVPLMGMIEDDFTVGFTRAADPNFIQFDTSKVPALQDDKNRVAQRASRALKDGTITVNEYREMIGQNPVADGDVYYRPNNVTVVPEGDLDEPPELPAPIAAAVPDEDENGRPPNDDEDQDRPPTENSPDTQTPTPRSLTPAESALSKQLEALRLMQVSTDSAGFDRALHVARIAGDIRSRMTRMARKSNGDRSEPIQGWLDDRTLEIGNALVIRAGDGPGVSEDLARWYGDEIERANGELATATEVVA